MALPNKVYWEQRILQQEAKAQRIANKAVTMQQALATKVRKNLELEIEALYAQMAADGALSRTQLWKYSKYTSLINRIDKEFNGLYGQQLSITTSALEQVFTSTFGFTVDALGRKDITFNIFTKNQMNKILAENWSGSHYSQRIWVNTSKLAKRIRDDVTQIVMAGQDINLVKKKLMDDFNTNLFNSQRLVRTEVSHVFNGAALQGYSEAGVSKVEFLLERDKRTCETCLSIANADSGLGRGIYTLANAPRIPQHAQCRCTYIPIVELPQKEGVVIGA